MTITEISRRTGVSRESVSRQMDILQVSGKVELSIIGNAKVYYIARRVPLSAFLCFTKHLILVARGALRTEQRAGRMVHRPVPWIGLAIFFFGLWILGMVFA